MKEKVWNVYRLGVFTDSLGEKVAAFYDYELAKDFVDYQTTLCNSFGVVSDGVLVYPAD